MNAWEDGNRIIADVMQFEEAPLFPHPDGRRTDPAEVAGKTVPLDVRSLRQHRPLHARLSRRRHRRIPAHRRPPRRFCQHARLVRLRQSGHAFVGGLVGRGACEREDAARRAQYLLPEGDTISEPVFVERGGDAAEGDGWLLAVVWRARENRSDLAVFNALDVASGPVALVQLGHRVPDGFHGNWVGAN